MAHWQRQIRSVSSPLPPSSYLVELVRETDKAYLLRHYTNRHEFWAPKSATKLTPETGLLSGVHRAEFRPWLESKLSEKGAIE